jgi:hypothetical protein
MNNPSRIQRVLDKLRDAGRRLVAKAKELWQAHLEKLATSPVYEAILLAVIELVLGNRVDLHQVLTRLTAKLRRTPPEIPDGWAY